ncbi:MAG: D-alanine--D-alanine ligase [Desulfovibrionaceae bacterium]|nr:D-alanine--D-alanine ligase [Desulfovibrionaceae bacterium]
MRIGMTYDLRSEYLAQGYSEEETAEFDRDDTVERLEAALKALGHAPERIGNAQALVRALAAGQRWDLVFNIAEGLRGPGREALVPALLDAYSIPYTFSGPLVMALTLDKAAAKRVVRDLGLATADFAVIRTPAEIRDLDLACPLFAKPLSEGTGKGVTRASRIDRPKDLPGVCLELLERFGQPVLVEAYLPGREFTVGVLGSGSSSRSVGVMEINLGRRADPGAYTYLNKEHFESRVTYSLARDGQAGAAEDLALAAWRGLGCLDAGRVDVRLDADGRPCFLEVNPLAGLHPEHSDLPILCTLAGMGFHELMAEILDCAIARIDAAGGRARGGHESGRAA